MRSLIHTVIGDRRGPRFFVYDLCYPEAPQDAMPHLLPRRAETRWKAHEVDYLRHQGAFETLPDSVCDSLVRCYFQHVHFFLPIVDAASFLAEYENNRGPPNISLLLFWSMLLAAANVSLLCRWKVFLANVSLPESLWNQTFCNWQGSYLENR
jgi:hypothetical protein